LGGAGAWDYLKADVDARRLYVSHSSEVIVIDLDTQKQIGSLKGFGFIHGIVVVKQLNKGFLSDGQKNEVVTFDPATLEIKSRIKTASNPNSMAYDQHNGRLFVGHKPSKSITVIKAASDKIESRIELGGIPEFPVTDGKGNLYVNIDDQSQIVQIDTETLKIKARWPLDPCKGPSGLALDSEGKRLFAACDNRLMAVVNAETGKVITTLPIGDGPDAAGFDPQTKLAFSSNGDGTLTVVKELANDKYVVLQNLATESGARTMTVDTNTHAVYLSAAKLGPPPAPTPQNPNPPKHPTAIDGTFKVLVASPR
jgi:streptogramin lyase